MTPEQRERKRAHDRAYYEANRDRILEQQRAYCEANRDRILEQQRAYCEANRDRILERQAIWREGRRPLLREQQRAYQATHREALRAYRATHRDRDRDMERERYPQRNAARRRLRSSRPDATRAEQRRWYESNPYLNLGGERTYIRQLEPGWREVAIAIKNARQAIREAQRGTAS
jgi:hypothetical protein